MTLLESSERSVVPKAKEVVGFVLAYIRSIGEAQSQDCLALPELVSLLDATSAASM